MPFHPNPISMAVHVEHHRQELLDDAARYRRANEAAGNNGPDLLRALAAVRTRIANGARAFTAARREVLNAPLDRPRAMPHSTPGEAT